MARFPTFQDRTESADPLNHVAGPGLLRAIEDRVREAGDSRLGE